jgi:hypothetical protein
MWGVGRGGWGCLCYSPEDMLNKEVRIPILLPDVHQKFCFYVKTIINKELAEGVVVSQLNKHWPANPDCLRRNPQFVTGNSHSLLNGKRIK